MGADLRTRLALVWHWWTHLEEARVGAYVAATYTIGVFAVMAICAGIGATFGTTWLTFASYIAIAMIGSRVLTVAAYFMRKGELLRDIDATITHHHVVAARAFLERQEAAQNN